MQSDTLLRMKTYTIVRSVRNSKTCWTLITDFGDGKISEQMCSSMRDAQAAREKCERQDDEEQLYNSLINLVFWRNTTRRHRRK